MKLINSYEVFDYTPEMIKESREQNGGKVVLKGILQKADTLNQNGRIYPRNLLEREVRNYQKFIIENRALGECVPPGTQIYTTCGWKNIEDISEDEEIYTLDVDSNTLVKQHIVKKVVQPFKGNLLRFKNHSTYDMCLTPNHKMLIWDRMNRPVTITASELHEAYKIKNSFYSHSSFRRAGAIWEGNTPEVFMELSPKYEIDPNLWAAFLGIYLAEGHSSGVNKANRVRYNNVILTQKNLEVQTAIENLLEQLPFDYNIIVRSDEQTKDYVIKCPILHEHLLKLGNSRQKYVPEYIKSWSPHSLNILLEWMLMGDGRHRKGSNNEFIPEYCTTSKRLAADVEEIMIKLGHGATIHVHDRSMDRMSPDPNRMILGENCADMNIVYQHSSKGMSLDFRFMKVEEVPYNGNVYCVTVPNGTWLMKYNGKVCWTHNCDHPDSSVVNLKNVSHIIKEAKMDNNVVYGKIELLDTPSGKILQSLVESGVKLGISSRGVGSTRKEGDYQVVQDDFQLICWDMVSEPSTPGAFMMSEGKSVSVDELNRVFTKQDRIDRIINDILYYRK